MSDYKHFMRGTKYKTNKNMKTIKICHCFNAQFANYDMSKPKVRKWHGLWQSLKQPILELSIAKIEQCEETKNDKTPDSMF